MGLPHAVNAGIQWGALGTEMIPIFEEQAARLEKNYRMDEWNALDRMERAMIIAVRRVDISMKNHQSEAEIKAAQRASKVRK